MRMSSIFIPCWDLLRFLSLRPGGHITGTLPKVSFSSSITARTHTPTQSAYQMLLWVGAWERIWEKETECSNLTSKIISWLWALWTWQILELTPSWFFLRISARTQLWHPCGRPCTFLFQLMPPCGPHVGLGFPLHTDSPLVCHCSSETPHGFRLALPCVVHICFAGNTLVPLAPTNECRSAPLSFVLPQSSSLDQLSFPLNFQGWRVEVKQ